MWVRISAKKPTRAVRRPSLEWRVSPNQILTLQGFPAIEMRKDFFVDNRLAADSWDCGPDPSLGMSMNIVIQFLAQAGGIQMPSTALLRAALGLLGLTIDAR
jgi:hypothetical protein